MKKLYQICAIFSFLVLIFGISSILVLTIARPMEYTQIKVDYVEVEQMTIERREDDRNLTFYYKTEENFSLGKVISISYSIYDVEQRAFVFIVDTMQAYIHATINSGGYASGIVIPK